MRNAGASITPDESAAYFTGSTTVEPLTDAGDVTPPTEIVMG